MISNRQLDRMPPWTWESLVSFKQQFGETRGILQFFGTMFKRTKNAMRKEKVKTTSALTTCCVLGSALDRNTRENGVQYGHVPACTCAQACPVLLQPHGL